MHRPSRGGGGGGPGFGGTGRGRGRGGLTMIGQGLKRRRQDVDHDHHHHYEENYHHTDHHTEQRDDRLLQGPTGTANQGANSAIPYPRKKKRGGREARAKDLKWKVAHGGEHQEPFIKQEHADQQVVVSSEGAVAYEADGMDVTLESTREEPETVSATVKPVSRPPPPATKPKVSKSLGLPDWIAHPLTVPDQITSTPESSVTNPSWGLSPRIVARLTEQKITHLFPVQTAVLPRLLQTRYSSASIPPGDLCVSAPTGSGKTLAYALPIVESLIDRVVPRVRALVVLPTRDLAAQVKATFDALLKGSSVRALLLTGQTPFATEQAQLVSDDPWDLTTEADGSSKVDIVIATPGRLMDHLKGTKGFTLRHLRFLVIDEADRLLNQSYQDWLSHVLEATQEAAHTTDLTTASAETTGWAALGFRVDDHGLPVHAAGTQRHPTAHANEISTPTATGAISVSLIHHYTPLQKLLFSATLTRNPAKIASLHLHSPVYVAVVSAAEAAGDADAISTSNADETRYVAPTTLEERMIVCPGPGDKPLMLLHILYNLDARGVLVFTKSVEAAHRLAALVQIFDRSWAGGNVAVKIENEDNESGDSDDAKTGTTTKKAVATITSPAEAFSSDLPPSHRRRLLASFRSGTLRTLVCSDVMARGMDLGAAVRHVVSYDVPTRTKTYVHRVGRTARAGREGTAWTVLEEREVRWFKGEVVRKVERVGGPGAVGRVKVGDADVKGLVEGYREALTELEGLVKGAAGVRGGPRVVDAKEEEDDAASSSASSSSSSSSDEDSDSDSESSDSSTSSSSSSSSTEATTATTAIDRPTMKVDTTLLEHALRDAATRLSLRKSSSNSVVTPTGREWWEPVV
ncbi:ATP-dependent RNA helicase dbp6 [Thoreauomyces humboldtii]|nr:ATP-dependent RNA helicase dbp6 [Thoreauomyces humboldtii]